MCCSKKGMSGLGLIIFLIIGMVILGVFYLAFVDVPERGEDVAEIIATGGKSSEVFVAAPKYSAELPGKTIAVAAGDADGDETDELIVLGEDEGKYYIYFLTYSHSEDEIVSEEYSLLTEDEFKPICSSGTAIDLAISNEFEGEENPIYVLRRDVQGEIDDVLKFKLTESFGESCFDYFKRIRVQTIQDIDRYRKQDHIGITADDFEGNADSIACMALASNVFTIDAGGISYPNDNGRESRSNLLGFCPLRLTPSTFFSSSVRWVDISSGDLEGEERSSMVFVKHDGIQVFSGEDFSVCSTSQIPVLSDETFMPLDKVGEGASFIRGDVGELEFGSQEKIYLLDNKGYVYTFDKDGGREKAFGVERSDYYDIAVWHVRGLDYTALLRENSVDIYAVPLSSGSLLEGFG